MSSPVLDVPDPSHALRARDLVFAYPDRMPVFENVAIDVKAREIVCLLGASGCGKSTLLKVLAQLEPAQRGSVEYFGEPRRAPHPRAALLFQRPGLLPWLNVGGNVGFGLDFERQPPISVEARRRRAQQALAAVGMSGQERLYPAQLSGGMAQRVALARALAREPLLLLADEPFSALDAITRADMQTLLVDLVQRWHTAALLVTHEIDEAILVADRIILMGLPAAGRPAGVLREWAVPIPRPRERHRESVMSLRLDILSALHAQRREP